MSKGRKRNFLFGDDEEKSCDCLLLNFLKNISNEKVACQTSVDFFDHYRKISKILESKKSIENFSFSAKFENFAKISYKLTKVKNLPPANPKSSKLVLDNTLRNLPVILDSSNFTDLAFYESEEAFLVELLEFNNKRLDDLIVGKTTGKGLFNFFDFDDEQDEKILNLLAKFNPIDFKECTFDMLPARKQLFFNDEHKKFNRLNNSMGQGEEFEGSFEEETVGLLGYVKNPDFLLDSLCCCVCLDNWVEQDDAIVMCEGCNFACHESCGNILNSKKSAHFFCNLCKFNRKKANHVFPSCAICDKSSTYLGGGIMKQIAGTHQWVHCKCALAFEIPLLVANDKYVNFKKDGRISMRLRSFSSQKCCICLSDACYCTSCCNKNCQKKMHVTCNLYPGDGLFLYANSGESFGSFSYCKDHKALVLPGVKRIRPNEDEDGAFCKGEACRNKDRKSLVNFIKSKFEIVKSLQSNQTNFYELFQKCLKGTKFEISAIN